MHNQRIERLWREVGKHFARSWKGFFRRLEQEYGLDASNPTHLWLLSALFMEDLNDACDRFTDVWNNHPMSGAGTHGLSPSVSTTTFIQAVRHEELTCIQALRHLGVTEHGLVLDENDEFLPDEFNDVPAEDLHLGLDVDASIDEDAFPAARAEGSDMDSGSEPDLSEPDDEDEIPTDQGLEDEIAEAVRVNSSTPAAKVPRVVSPLASEAEQEEFFNALNAIRRDDVVPDGYGLNESEDNFEEWESEQEIGRVGNVKNARVTLTEEVWRPRVIEWVQALEAWHHFQG